MAGVKVHSARSADSFMSRSCCLCISFISTAPPVLAVSLVTTCQPSSCLRDGAAFSGNKLFSTVLILCKQSPSRYKPGFRVFLTRRTYGTQQRLASSSHIKLLR